MSDSSHNNHCNGLEPPNTTNIARNRDSQDLSCPCLRLVLNQQVTLANNIALRVMAGETTSPPGAPLVPTTLGFGPSLFDREVCLSFSENISCHRHNRKSKLIRALENKKQKQEETIYIYIYTCNTDIAELLGFVGLTTCSIFKLLVLGCHPIAIHEVHAHGFPP